MQMETRNDSYNSSIVNMWTAVLNARIQFIVNNDYNIGMIRAPLAIRVVQNKKNLISLLPLLVMRIAGVCYVQGCDVITNSNNNSILLLPLLLQMDRRKVKCRLLYHCDCYSRKLSCIMMFSHVTWRSL